MRWITESVRSEASEMLACDVGALFLHSTDGACPMAVALPKYAALKASRSWSRVSCWATKTFCSLSMTPPRYQHAFHFMCPAGFSWSTSKSRAKDQHSPSDSRVYLQAGWGADTQPWDGHRRAGGWLRRGCGRWPGRGGTPWPMAVAGMAVRCCRFRRRQPYQQACVYSSTRASRVGSAKHAPSRLNCCGSCLVPLVTVSVRVGG